MADVEAGFAHAKGFPGVVGAIDGSLIEIERRGILRGSAVTKGTPPLMFKLSSVDDAADAAADGAESLSIVSMSAKRNVNVCANEHQIQELRKSIADDKLRRPHFCADRLCADVVHNISSFALSLDRSREHDNVVRPRTRKLQVAMSLSCVHITDACREGMGISQTTYFHQNWWLDRFKVHTHDPDVIAHSGAFDTAITGLR
ncbi:hypothetical protein FI667_g9861, partial [Globisporangium splendens]